MSLAQWNPTAGKRWNHLLTLIERHYGVRPKYFRAAETQQRGALHHHVLIWSPRKLTEPTLRPLAMVAGYGHEIDLQPIERGSRLAAQYVTKRVAGYVTKSADERGDLPWFSTFVDRSTGEVRQGHTDATFRTWSSSRSWGSTMRELVARDRVEWLERAALSGQSVGRPVATESPPAPS